MTINFNTLKRGAFRKAGGNANVNAGANKDAPISTVIEEYKVKMPEGSKARFRKIATQSQYTDSQNKALSLNYNLLVELLESGALTVNEKGYINGIRVFESYKG